MAEFEIDFAPVAKELLHTKAGTDVYGMLGGDWVKQYWPNLHAALVDYITNNLKDYARQFFDANNPIECIKELRRIFGWDLSAAKKVQMEVFSQLGKESALEAVSQSKEK